MDYSLDEQTQDVAEISETILTKTVTAQRLADLEAAGEHFDRDLWADLAGSGLVGIAIAEEYDGSGAGFTELCAVINQAARVAAPIFLVETAVLAALPIQEFGSDELKQRLLPGFAAGESILTSGLNLVPNTPLTVTAEKAAENAAADDGTWTLTGTLSHVALADRADRVLVAARDAQGRTGLFLVDPTLARVSPQTSVDRHGRSQLEFDSTPVEARDVLVAPGAFTDQMQARIQALGVAAYAIAQLGTLQSALRATADYVSDRLQFGRAIGTFQAVAHRIADAYVDVQAVHLTAWRAAWLAAEGVVDDRASALAGFWAADAANRVGETAMQLHGGVSVDLEFGIHRFYLAARQTTLLLGGPNRRLNVLGRLIANGAA